MKTFSLKFLKQRDFWMVLFCILLSKSLYFESYGKNWLLGVFFVALMSSHFFNHISLRALVFSPLLTFRKFFKKSLVIIRTDMFFSKALFSKVKNRNYFLIVSYVVFFMVLVLLNPETQLSSALVLLVRLLIAVFVVHLLSFRQFSDMFIKIMIPIIILSSLFPFLIIRFNVHSFLPNFTCISGLDHRNFIFFGVMDFFIEKVDFRNSGLWWEPGAFQVFINLAFMFSLINKTIDMKKYIIFMVGVVTTFSTTGVMVYILLSILYFKEKIKKINLSRMIFPFLIILFATFLFFIWPFLSKKFTVISCAHGHCGSSFASRYYDFEVSVRMFFEHWLLGYGFGSQLKNAIPYGQLLLSTKMFQWYRLTGSDGISMLISQCGIFSIPLVIPFLFPKYYKGQGVFAQCIMTCSLILMFNTENFSFILIFSLLSLYGLVGNESLTMPDKNTLKSVERRVALSF